jgi:hypothetical protein
MSLDGVLNKLDVHVYVCPIGARGIAVKIHGSRRPKVTINIIQLHALAVRNANGAIEDSLTKLTRGPRETSASKWANAAISEETVLAK